MNASDRERIETASSRRGPDSAATRRGSDPLYTARISNGPLAYHITFGTYGTRLHGDPRGTVDRTLNNPGDPIIGADGGWQRIERSRLNFPPVVLSDELRRFADSIVPNLCERGGWTFHACATRPDHVHVLLSTDREGKAVRSWLKRWLGEALCKRWPLPDGAGWWAKGGSVKWVWQDRYFHNVRKYILCQRRAR